MQQEAREVGGGEEENGGGVAHDSADAGAMPPL